MSKPKKAALFIFLALEAILYSLILFVEINWYIHSVICFVSIAVSNIFGWIFLEKKPYFILCAASTVTLIADFLLECVVPAKQISALTCFFIAQFLYAVYISSFSKLGENVIHLVVRVFINVIAGIIATSVLKEKLDYLSLVATLYFGNLLVNIGFALVHIAKHPLLAIGLILFALCDVTLGLLLGLKEGYIAIEGPLRDFLLSPFDFVWFFYVPSQVLLMCEIYHQQKKNIYEE